LQLIGGRASIRLDTVKPSLRGAIVEVRYRSLFGWIKQSEVEGELSVIARMDGRTVAAGRFTGDHPQVPGARAFQVILPTEPIAVNDVRAVVLDSCGAVKATLSWGLEDALLPEAWCPGGRCALPSFFVLGAAKAGTTSLHHYLDQHPEIFMSKPKEPFFFEAEYDRGARFYFSKYFGGWKGERLVGESRHRNLFLPFVPRRIHAYNPDAKLIAILRNPAERAVSHWWHWYSRNLEPLPLEDALQRDFERIAEERGIIDDSTLFSRHVKSLDLNGQSCCRTYLDSGYYCEQLQRYIELFGRSRLHIILFDDMAADSACVTSSVFRFLGVRSDSSVSIDCTPINRSIEGMRLYLTDRVRSWLIDHFAPHNRRLEQLLERHLEWDRCF
jgi:hypothetical protein